MAAAATAKTRIGLLALIKTPPAVSRQPARVKTNQKTYAKTIINSIQFSITIINKFYPWEFSVSVEGHGIAIAGGVTIGRAGAICHIGNSSRQRAPPYQ